METLILPLIQYCVTTEVRNIFSMITIRNSRFLFFLMLLVGRVCALDAQEAEPMYGSNNPKIYCVEENGQPKEVPDTLQAGEPFVGSAPMRVVCESHIDGPEGMQWRCEWNLSKSPGFEVNEFTRFEDDTELDFSDSGTYYIRLQVTYVYADGKEVSDESETFSITVSESQLKVPNAFSPNGDGINDVFKVSYKSLVKFDAYVFNRWGQKIYHWGLKDIDNGWDGTFHGKQVKDGVYFIVIDAEGSDGIKYRHKGDITILRGFTGSGTSSDGSATGNE